MNCGLAMSAELVSFVLSHFLRQGRPQERYRDTKTGKFIARPNMFRASVGVKQIPINSYPDDRHYYNVMIQAWSTNPDDLDTEQLEKLFFIELEKFIGYDEVDFWFPTELDIEDPSEVSVTEDDLFKLPLTWEFFAEEKERTVYSRWGWL